VPVKKKAAPAKLRTAKPRVAKPRAAAPVDRDAEFARVRAVVQKHIPEGYQEQRRGKMIVWEVPLSVYPDTYNGHALWYAAMVPQKNYLTLHLMGAYGSPVLAKRIADGFKAAGKKLDMGKAWT
jgi:hypothetical protein